MAGVAQDDGAEFGQRNVVMERQARMLTRPVGNRTKPGTMAMLGVAFKRSRASWGSR